MGGGPGNSMCVASEDKKNRVKRKTEAGVREVSVVDLLMRGRACSEGSRVEGEGRPFEEGGNDREGEGEGGGDRRHDGLNAVLATLDHRPPPSLRHFPPRVRDGLRGPGGGGEQEGC